MPKKELCFTDFDYLVGEPQLQMMKAALPFMQVPTQRSLSLVVKMIELQKTAELFQNDEPSVLGACSADSPPPSPLEMLEAIKPYGGASEQEFIDVVMNFMQGFQIYQKYQASAETTVPSSPLNALKGGSKFPLEQLKAILPASMQERLETIQLMMQTMEAFT